MDYFIRKLKDAVFNAVRIYFTHKNKSLIIYSTMTFTLGLERIILINSM